MSCRNKLQTLAGRSESMEDLQLSLDDDWDAKNDALLSWSIAFDEGAPICSLFTSTYASDVLAMLAALPLLGLFE